MDAGEFTLDMTVSSGDKIRSVTYPDVKVEEGTVAELEVPPIQSVLEIPLSMTVTTNGRTTIVPPSTADAGSGPPGVSGTSPTPGGGTTSAVDLGSSWNLVGAGGWTGVWTRRGNSNTFDGVWTGPQGQRETTVVTVTIVGRNVTANRTQSSDGFLCRYTGQVASDGVTVRGDARCGDITFDWSATITGAGGGDGRE